MSMPCFPLELRSGQCVDAVILRMGSDKFHKRYLPPEVECDDQAIIPSCDLEPDTIAIQHPSSGSRFLDFICRGPARRSNELIPAFERRSCLGVVSPKASKRIPSNYSHAVI